jgi:hypothetical protein
MSEAMTVRDFEVLRTLLRVQVATTGALQATFFSQLRLARRRMAALRERGYVTTHDKGLRGPMSVSAARYWRLTSQGLQVVTTRFPSERVPNNAVLRAANASLRYFEHRDAITELYLGLVATRDKDPDEVTRRADAITWHGEYDVELEQEEAVGAELVVRRIVPDATMETSGGRFFLEIDRSTETRGRCLRTMKAYSRHVEQGRYAGLFRDERAAYLVYITRSEARAQGLRAIAGQLASQVPVVVLRFDEAISWLSRAAMGEVGAPAPSAAGANDGQADLVTVLRDVYELAREAIQRRRQAGEAVPAPECLRRAYDILQAAGAP